MLTARTAVTMFMVNTIGKLIELQQMLVLLPNEWSARQLAPQPDPIIINDVVIG